LAVLQVLNLAYNAASLAAWMFYSGMYVYLFRSCIDAAPSRFRTGITARAVNCFVIVHQLWRCSPPGCAVILVFQRQSFELLEICVGQH